MTDVMDEVRLMREIAENLRHELIQVKSELQIVRRDIAGIFGELEDLHKQMTEQRNSMDDKFGAFTERIDQVEFNIEDIEYDQTAR